MGVTVQRYPTIVTGFASVTGHRCACGHESSRRRVGLVDFRRAVPVILEHALLPVKPREEAGFESAFAEAKAIIAGVPGFRRLTLSRCLEGPNSYLLLV